MIKHYIFRYYIFTKVLYLKQTLFRFVHICLCNKKNGLRICYKTYERMLSYDLIESVMVPIQKDLFFIKNFILIFEYPTSCTILIIQEGTNK